MYAEPQLYEYDRPRPMVPLGTLLITSGALLYRTYNDDGSHQTKVISEASLKAAVLSLNMDTGWLPACMRLLRYGESGASHYTLVFCPPRQETIFITEADGHVAQRWVPLPGMVFVSLNHAYLAWAIQPEADGTYDPGPTTALYHAPFPNLNQDGKICWGANPVSDGRPSSMLSAWQTFLRSPFTSSESFNRCQSYSNDVRRLWAELAQQKATVFPPAELLPASRYRTLGSVFDGRLIEPVKSTPRTDADRLAVRDYDPPDLEGDEDDDDFDL